MKRKLDSDTTGHSHEVDSHKVDAYVRFARSLQQDHPEYTPSQRHSAIASNLDQLHPSPSTNGLLAIAVDRLANWEASHSAHAAAQRPLPSEVLAKQQLAKSEGGEDERRRQASVTRKPGRSRFGAV